MQNFNKSYSPFYNNIHRRNFIPPNYSSFPFSPNTLKSSNSNFFPNNQESEKKSDSKNNNIQSNTPSKSLLHLRLPAGTKYARHGWPESPSRPHAPLYAQTN